MVSLDFELHWGIRDRQPVDAACTAMMKGARLAVERMLELFASYDVAATWATVGFLFAHSRAEVEGLPPSRLPDYRDARLNPWSEELGDGEEEDPVHFAPSLIEAIRDTPRQEVASHTYSHFYCGKAGASVQSFEADLRAAQKIARKRGMTVRTLVFPRNQVEPAFLQVLPSIGFDAYRGNPPGWLWSSGKSRVVRRLGRLLDAYIPVVRDTTQGWNQVLEPGGLTNVRASRFLRPYNPALVSLEPLRFRRIVQGLRHAARKRRLYHLWWHPHNFGTHTDRNLDFLRRVLDVFAEEREAHGMVSLTMAEVADLARQMSGSAPVGTEVRGAP